MYTFKLFARKEQSSKKGTQLIYILKPNNIKIATPHYCLAGSWNQKDQIVTKRDPLHQQTNARLKRLSGDLQKLIDEGHTIPEIRKRLKPKAEEIAVITVPINNPDVYSELTVKGKEFYMLVERIIHSHRADWSEGYKKRFRSLCTKILTFDKYVTIDNINDEWYREYVNWCIKRGNISNTIHTDTKTLNALGKELGRKWNFEWGYIEPEVQGLSWDKVLYLNSQELINKILDYPKATLNDSRKKWLAGAFIGRRWEEVEGIGPSNFYQKKGKWRYKNIGKGNKIIDMPLLDEAIEFFKSVGFKLPLITNQTVNEDIKIICRLANFKDSVLVIKPVDANNVIKEIKEEWETVHYHTGRHSYGQYIAQLAAGRPHADKFVSYMLGHASYQTTWKYMNRSASSNEQMFDEIFTKT